MTNFGRADGRISARVLYMDFMYVTFVSWL